MENPRLATEGLALLSRPVRPTERYDASAHAPLERYDVRAEQPTRAVAREAAIGPTRTFFAGPGPLPEVFAADGSEDTEHPENGKNFPLWKKIVLIVGDIFAYISVFILISPIPFGWAMVPMSIFILSIAVGKKHAKRHLVKVTNDWKDTFWYGTFADVWMPWLLKKPWVQGTLGFLEVVSRPVRIFAKEFIDTMKDGLAFAWELVRPKRKKKEKKEPATA